MKMKASVKNRKPLWKCPKCGERFTGKNMWHSCGKFSLENVFQRSEPQVLRLFRQFTRLLRTCGSVHMIPQKTRVVFQVRMRFAGATPRKSSLICHFILPRKIDSRRFHKIETFSPRCHAHYLRITSPDELNADVARWLEQAYQVGRQCDQETRVSKEIYLSPGKQQKKKNRAVHPADRSKESCE
jgi:Domain of unknown function (DUF5655)